MTVKEYLNQAYRLEQRIRLLKDNIEETRALSGSISSPGFEQHYNPNRPTEAPYVKTLERLMEMQEELDEKLSLLLALKAELTEVIDGVENMDERLVLTYRYLKNFTWSHIGDILCADERTVRRWHSLALAHVIVPENPTVIP